MTKTKNKTKPNNYISEQDFQDKIKQLFHDRYQSVRTELENDEELTNDEREQIDSEYTNMFGQVELLLGMD